MIDRPGFDALLKKHARVSTISGDDVLFGSGVDISSLRFTEFIMELEEVYDIDIDVDDLDASIVTVEQLYSRIAEESGSNS